MFNIPLWPVLALAVLAATAFYAYYTGPDTLIDRTLTFLAVSIGVIAAVATAVYEAVSVQDAHEANELDKKQKAFDLACRWNSQEMRDKRSSLREATQKLKNCTDNDRESVMQGYDLNISIVFGYFEEIGSAIHNELVDEDVLYDLLRNAIVRNTELLRWWINLKRDRSHKTLWERTTKLAAKWRDRIDDES